MEKYSFLVRQNYLPSWMVCLGRCAVMAVKTSYNKLGAQAQGEGTFSFFYVVLMLASPWFTRLVFMLASYVWIRLSRHLLRDFMKCRPKAQFYSLPVEYTMGIVFLDTFSISVTENLFHFSQNSSFFSVPGKAYHPTEQSALGITKCGRIERNFIVSAKFLR